MTNTTPSPKLHLSAAARHYPGAWRMVDHYRAERGGSFPDWPDWCYLPIAAACGIVASDAGVPINLLPTRYPERVQDASRLAALASWRVTQGIYRYDPTLYAALLDTPLTGDVPHEVLFRLPEWCVYIETPGLTWSADADTLHGFWAHLEHDPSGRVELRFLLDHAEGLTPIPLHVGAWSLAESVSRMFDTALEQAAIHGLPSPAPSASGLSSVASRLTQLLSLLLYLCAEDAEIGSGSSRPLRPTPKRTKRGLRLFAPDKPTSWDVGVRLGAALRRAQPDRTASSGSSDATHAPPRPHIRRAHWHSFRTGPRKSPTGNPVRPQDRPAHLKWLPPIAVGVSDIDALPAVIHPVEPGST